MEALKNDAGLLDVMILYPDGLARTRVMSVFQRIHDKMWPTVEFDVSWGKFEHLEDPTVRRFLEAALVTADILCVATRNHAELPVTVTNWLSAIQYPRDDRPLVALLDISHRAAPGEEGQGAASFLEIFAHTHHMDFLPYYTADLAAPEPQDSVVGPADKLVGSRFPTGHWRFPAETSSLNE